MGQVSRGHWRSSVPTLLLIQGALEHISRVCLWIASESLHRRRQCPRCLWAHCSSAQPVHPHSEKALPHVKGHFPYYRFCPLPLGCLLYVCIHDYSRSLCSIPLQRLFYGVCLFVCLLIFYCNG